MGSRGHTTCCNCGSFSENQSIERNNSVVTEGLLAFLTLVDSTTRKPEWSIKFDETRHDTTHSFFDSNIYKRPSDRFLNAINIYNLKKDSDHLPRYKLLSPPGRYLRSGWCYYTNQWTDYETQKAVASTHSHELPDNHSPLLNELLYWLTHLNTQEVLLLMFYPLP